MSTPRIFFNFFEVIEKEGFKGSLPFKISAGQDMSSIQKTLGKGGGSHTKHFFCHCCQVQRDKRATPNVHKCDSCKNKDVDCYHFKVADANCLEVYAELMSELCIQYPHLTRLPDIDTVISIEETQFDMENDITHINFQSQSIEDSLRFSVSIRGELQKRGLSSLGRLSEIRDHLKDVLIL